MAWAMRSEKSFPHQSPPGMAAAGVACGSGGVQAVLVAVLGGHDTVCGHEDGTVEGLKLLLLFPPGIAVVAHKIGVLLEGRVVVSRQHLRVGVDVHSGSLGLLQEHLQVPQVVAGDQDARVLPHADVDPGDLRVSVGGGVGLVQQGHARKRRIFRSPGQKQPDRPVSRSSSVAARARWRKSVHLFVLVQQGVGVLGVGGQALFNP